VQSVRQFYLLAPKDCLGHWYRQLLLWAGSMPHTAMLFQIGLRFLALSLFLAASLLILAADLAAIDLPCNISFHLVVDGQKD
jgi:hypothetical protein